MLGLTLTFKNIDDKRKQEIKADILQYFIFSENPMKDSFQLNIVNEIILYRTIEINDENDLIVYKPANQIGRREFSCLDRRKYNPVRFFTKDRKDTQLLVHRKSGNLTSTITIEWSFQKS